MKVNRPLVVLDLETTGTWVEKDRIVEIALVRCEVDGSMKEYDQRVNPEMMIPKESSDITGITNDDVKDCPTFREIAKDVVAFIGDADIGGFNVERFDLPLLKRELNEGGVPFSWEERIVFDSQKIYHLNEKRDLTAAYSFYCGKDLEGAHAALADTRATLDVLKSQVEKYGDGDIELLQEFEYKSSGEFYDEDRKFRWWDGSLYMMFGKYSRKKTLKQVVKADPRYLEWILSADFSEEIKDLVSRALDGNFPSYLSSR